MPYHQPIVNLNGGEFSPILDARIDLSKYGTGHQILENFLLTPAGAIIRRPGTEFIGRPKHNDRKCILYGFNFSTTTTFLLEIGHLYTRFWSNGFQVAKASADAWVTATPYVVGDYVTSLSLIYYCVENHTSGAFLTDVTAGRWVQQGILEVPSPWSEGDLHDLQFQAINDIIYVVHPEHFVRKFTRVADDDWTLGEIDWTFPPTITENFEDITITPSATTGSITLTASDDIFKTTHIGSWWTIAHRRAGNGNSFVQVALDATSTTSGAISVLGSWEFTTYGTWQGEVRIERKVPGTSQWEPIRTYNNNVLGQRNVAATGVEERISDLRVRHITAGVAGTNGVARLEVGESKYYGAVQISAVASPTSASATVKIDLFSTAATAFWAEAAFSDEQGHPRSICWHNLRLVFGGTRKKPLSVHGSTIDDFENFRQGSRPDEAVSFTISARESSPIQWMLSQKKNILIGTASGELEIGATDESEAMGPTNIRSTNQSSHGSAHLQAILVNEVIIFLQRQGKKLREYAFDFSKDGWVGPDLTILASHISGANSHIIRTCFQQQPDATLWCPISSGEYLPAMSYERDQNVVGWHRHTTQGVFEDAATVFGGEDSDEVWFVVRREVNGQTVRYIERLHPTYRTDVELEDKENWWYLDCGIRRTFGTDMSTITGLDHLEGMFVSVMVDGAVQPDKHVVGGSITLEHSGRNVLVGLSYRSTSKPSKFNLNTQNGTSIGRNARVHRSTFRMYKSLGLETSVDGINWKVVTFRKDGDAMDTSPPAFTGDKTLAVDGVYRPTGELWFRDGGPYPLQILAVVPEYDFHGT